ncbi:MAG: amidohydrolase family protein [Actinobacteria bacterium]|nr:amidohydrolase family protein [Actinomycetota bacterium]MBO0784690.1 amidohydrolase family protein [Actinomycetota bacterium]MBO0816424.1 amidohydrolase family protein [Actinomycetota bacterium]
MRSSGMDVAHGLIDAHVHHLDLDRFRYPWLEHPDFRALRAGYPPAGYLADTAGTPVAGWVHVQAEVDHALDPVAETGWVSALAEEARAAGVPGPLGCVVYADLRAPDLPGLLARHTRYPLTRGVRQETWFDPASTRADIPRRDLLSDPAWREGYAALAGFGLSFDLLAWPSQLPQAAAIAAAAPDVPVVLEHLGLPDPARDRGLKTWRAGVAALAGLRHACVKLSAFSLLGSPPDTPRVREVVGELLELFGPERCMVGSNFPVERLAGGFGSWYQLVLAALEGLPGDDRAEVLHGTARRFYRLP